VAAYGEVKGGRQNGVGDGDVPSYHLQIIAARRFGQHDARLKEPGMSGWRSCLSVFRA
jgi:hypothetical protein